MSKATISFFERIREKSRFTLYSNYLMYRYKFSRVIAESLFKDNLLFSKFFSDEERTDGQIIYQAVKKDEPAGKALKDCQYINLKLTLQHSGDDKIRAEKGLAELRRYKLRRLCEESATQGAPLSQEDLASLLNVGRSTVIRDIALLKKQKIEIITRSYYTDQGRGTSHKEQIIKLYLQGFSLTEIANRSNHALENVQRYLYDFLRINLLYQEDKSVLIIARVIKVTQSLVNVYIALYDKLQSDPVYQESLERQLSFYASQLELTEFKKKEML